MADTLDSIIFDEAEFAGYVDSGIWMIEEYLADLSYVENLRKLYFSDLWRDYFGQR